VVGGGAAIGVGVIRPAIGVDWAGRGARAVR